MDVGDYILEPYDSGSGQQAAGVWRFDVSNRDNAPNTAEWGWLATFTLDAMVVGLSDVDLLEPLGGAIWLDNFMPYADPTFENAQVKVTPEPFSIVLFGVGAAVALRRRR